MMLYLSKPHLAPLCIAVASIAIVPTVSACTSLLYSDANDHYYAGRTMELPHGVILQGILLP